MKFKRGVCLCAVIFLDFSRRARIVRTRVAVSQTKADKNLCQDRIGLDSLQLEHTVDIKPCDCSLKLVRKHYTMRVAVVPMSVHR